MIWKTRTWRHENGDLSEWMRIQEEINKLVGKQLLEIEARIATLEARIEEMRRRMR